MRSYNYKIKISQKFYICIDNVTKIEQNLSHSCYSYFCTGQEKVSFAVFFFFLKWEKKAIFIFTVLEPHSTCNLEKKKRTILFRFGYSHSALVRQLFFKIKASKEPDCLLGNISLSRGNGVWRAWLRGQAILGAMPLVWLSAPDLQKMTSCPQTEGGNEGPQ